MEFSDAAITLLKKAGWYIGRKLDVEELILPYDDYPQLVIDFLREFGNLEGDCEKQSYTEVVNSFYSFPSMEKEDLTGDNFYPYYSKLIDKKLFPLGGYLPDSYYICCDNDGRVYMIGEYCYFWGNNLIEGIDRILRGNWRNSLQLDEDTGKWWNDDAEYVELPPLE